MRQAFSLLELFIVIALSGVMAILSFNYFDTTAFSKESIKTELQSQLMTISSAVMQCRELSGDMPVQSGGAQASDTLLNTLECNTSTPYALDGGKGVFIPPPLSGFSEYRATQSGTAFYVRTTTGIDSRNDEVLQDLNGSYSPNQYVLSYDATTAYLDFYLSR